MKVYATGSPWENGYVKSFNGKVRDELLGYEVFNSLAEAKVLIEQWRMHYSHGSKLRPRLIAPLPALIFHNTPMCDCGV